MKNTKKAIFNYLEGFCFTYWYEIILAIEEYYRENIEKNEKFSPSYWELIQYQNIAREYANKKWYIFDDREH